MKKIALVEDNPDNRLFFRTILREYYEVAEYENGADSCEDLQQHKPDLVLLDISLPDMDGMEVLRRVRTDAALKNLPVTALTAYDMLGEREQFLAAGFTDYVTKPILDETILLQTIERSLTRCGVRSRTQQA